MKNNYNRIILFILLVLVVIWQPLNWNETTTANYFVDSFCLLISVLLLLRESSRKDLDMFDPLFIVSIFYLGMYFLAPIHDMHYGIYEWYGYSLFDYGPKTSLIAFGGYLSFFYAYKKYKNKNEGEAVSSGKTVNCGQLRKLSLWMYAICFVANVYYMAAVGGSSILYILSLGMVGSADISTASDSSLGFISMLSYSLPTATMLCWEYCDNKLLKILLFIPMLMLQVARGFRFFIVQIAISFMAYYFLKKGTRPRISTLISYCIAFMIPILLMTTFRDSIRQGHGMDTSQIDSKATEDAFDAAVWENLRIYQNVYGMVAVIPEKYPYCYFDEIVTGTAVMFVPRILWPNKPSMYGGEGLSVLIGSNIGSGQAYPNLGEFYYSMGIFGVLFYMFIYGLWMGKVHRKYKAEGSSADALNIIMFSVLLGTNIQLIIRGYTPSNFWYVVFAVLPIYYIKRKRIII